MYLSLFVFSSSVESNVGAFQDRSCALETPGGGLCLGTAGQAGAGGEW